MSEFFRRHSLNLTTVGLLIVTLQLMSMSVANRSVALGGAQIVNSVLSPVEKTYNELVQSARYLWNHYIYLMSVEEERVQLINRVKELEAHNSKLMEFEHENRRLRSLLHFSERTGMNGVVAFVIGRDPSNWVKSVTIDRGSVDGIRPGLAVVDGNAIVGQTTAVSRTSSKVLLLTDSASAIDAIVQRNRAVGTAEGGLGRTSLRLRYVLKLKEFQIEPGDRVISSGLDGVYPKGGLIGVVSSVNPSAGGLFQEVELQPSVDVYRLESVLVLIPELKRVTEPVSPPPEAAARPEQAIVAK